MRPPLKKRLGQHHLRSGGLCRPILDFLEPAGRRVVEIGPGGGVLTRELLTAGVERVVGLEIDLQWAAYLRRAIAEPRLAVAVADASRWPWAGLPSPTVVAGNLPFQVASPIVRRLLPHHRTVPRAAFLVQREVAERWTAAPGDGAYGALTVVVQAYARVRRLGVVRRGSFHPPPQVEGAFVGLLLRPPPLPEAEMEPFLRLVRSAFAQRRKTLRNNLGSLWGRQVAERRLEDAGIDARARAQELPLEAFLRLYDAAR